MTTNPAATCISNRYIIIDDPESPGRFLVVGHHKLMGMDRRGSHATLTQAERSLWICRRVPQAKRKYPEAIAEFYW
jgi:hypothetical protein